MWSGSERFGEIYRPFCHHYKVIWLITDFLTLPNSILLIVKLPNIFPWEFIIVRPGLVGFPTVTGRSPSSHN